MKLNELRLKLNEKGLKLKIQHERVLLSECTHKLSGCSVIPPNTILMIAPKHELVKVMQDTPYTAISSKGGSTTLTVVDTSGEVVCTSHAICNPKDAFVKNLGVQIAINRLLRQEPISKVI